MPKHTIIGTAGHIDHGKTALIKALTGLETDILKEEKERGITIDLGFAYWRDNVTIIDVPGHERFVKTMVAGVSTVDLFLLVIAADDGVMPQTVEHLDILRFFGVREGLVALNKIDAVDSEWLELVIQDVKSFLEKQGYGHVPVYPVSALTGDGVEELRNALIEKIDQIKARKSARPFRLNVDRSFHVHGSGTVVTGTVLSDVISTEQTVSVFPAEIKAKVRSIQVHQKSVQQAAVGQRAALNLSGIRPQQVERGSTLILPGTLEPVTEFLAVLHTAGNVSLKIKRHQPVRVYLGTAELRGRLTWFEEGAFLEPSQTYHVRVRLEEKALCAPQDAVLIRSISPFATVAGGRVLLLNPPPFGRLKEGWQELFAVLENGSFAQRLTLYFELLGFCAASLPQIAAAFFEKMELVQKEVQKLVQKKVLLPVTSGQEERFVLVESLNRAQKAFLKLLDKNDNSAGWNRNELWDYFKKLHGDETFFTRLLQRMLNKQLLVSKGELFLTANQAAKFANDAQRKQILEFVARCGFKTPTVEEIAQHSGIATEEVKKIVRQLVKENKLQSLQGKYYLHQTAMENLLAFLRDHFAKSDTLDLALVKQFTAVSRKYLIPLMEFLDQNHFTQRKGDQRFKGPQL